MNTPQIQREESDVYIGMGKDIIWYNPFITGDLMPFLHITQVPVRQDRTEPLN